MAKNKVRTISDIIGPTRVDHSAYRVRTGMLDAAVKFFTKQLLWIEDGPSVTGDWGTAKFVRQQNTTWRIQLTEDLSHDPFPTECVDDGHLAIAVMIVSAYDAANNILDWAFENGYGQDAYIMKVSADGTWMVYLPALFTFAIEVVKVKAFRTS